MSGSLVVNNLGFVSVGQASQYLFSADHSVLVLVGGDNPPSDQTTKLITVRAPISGLIQVGARGGDPSTCGSDGPNFPVDPNVSVLTLNPVVVNCPAGSTVWACAKGQTCTLSWA